MFDYYGNEVGRFLWAYGRVRNDDGTVIHGWWPYAHSAWNQPWTYHAVPA
jgi:hypothetical protein